MIEYNIIDCYEAFAFVPVTCTDIVLRTFSQLLLQDPIQCRLLQYRIERLNSCTLSQQPKVLFIIAMSDYGIIDCNQRSCIQIVESIPQQERDETGQI